MPSIPKILLKDYTAGQLDLDESSLDQNSSLYFMLQRVGRRKDVLDLGCSTGYFAKLMSAHDCNVTGIDVNPDVVEEAKKYCSRVFIADLDFTPLAEAVEGKTFDVIVFGDILEHLRNPADILDESRRLLRADGYVVASIPNVAHGAIRLALLNGNFDYRELGILDETHLRFFTLKTIEELFLEAGYEIRHIDRTKVDVFDNTSELSAVPAVSRDEFPEETIAQIQRDPESNTLQYIIQAFPLTDEAKLRAITKQYIKVNTELSRAQSLIERQTDLLVAVKAENQEPMLQADKARLEALESELQQRVTEREALAADRDTWRARVSAELPVAQAEVTRLAAAHAEAIAERDRLLSELQTRAAEREALAADRDTWRGKVSAELPAAQAEVARLAALASDLQARAQQHDAAHAALLAERDRLLSELQTRAAEREALAADRDTWREKVAVELPAAQAEVARLAALVSELRQLSIEREAAHTEAAAGFTREIDGLRSKVSAMEALQSELDSLKDELESVKVQRDSSSVMARQQSLVAQRLQQTLAQSSARIGTLEEELANLSSMMQETHEEMAKAQEALRARDSEVEGAVKHIASLENEIGQVQQVLKTRDSEVEHAVARIADLENEIGQVQQVLKTRDSELGQSTDRIAALEAEQTEAAKRLAALENVKAGLEQKLASAHEAASEVQQRLNETQNRLFAQTNLFLASTQAENERLTLLIDTVQSSRFWKIKRILGRFRQALAG